MALQNLSAASVAAGTFLQTKRKKRMKCLKTPETRNGYSEVIGSINFLIL